ncbi:MAG: glycosyl transferase [Spongiibacter sp.]|nr:glycosyl transferase [Spongiibacter sp.]MBI57648.1 glycosyl transferase [Spongiibacter sp.]|tara:strand:- start:370 stop:1119 length:750 start_codon:yes stop_codon:yes gene_type:complete
MTGMVEPLLSIVLPLRNERAILPVALSRLGRWQQAYPDIEWLFVDGGSADGSLEYLREHGQRVLECKAGRARQMNAGAQLAAGRYLLFLHVDTQLNRPALEALLAICRDTSATWGRFDVRLEGRLVMLKLIAALMNLRSRLTGIATGDMGIFVRRDVFVQVGGYPAQPLMEDIELSRRLRRLARPHCLRSRIVTSGRRWEQQGCWRTIVLMWWLRLQYFAGVPAEQLVRSYYPDDRQLPKAATPRERQS